MSEDTLIGSDVEEAAKPGVVKIQAKAKRPLIVDYGGTEYELPGRIPPAMMTAQAQIRRPTLTTQAIKDEYQKQVGLVVLAAFFENVVPQDLQNAIDMEDIEPVFQAWSNHVELGK